MERQRVVALLLLAFAVTCKAQYGLETIPGLLAQPRNFFERLTASLAGLGRSSADAHDGYDTCEGKITAVWCKEDEGGHLVDIAYRNSVTGLQLAGCGEDDWTSEATKVLLMTQNENIIDVKTCKGTLRSGMSLAITTDLGRTFTCGHSDGTLPHPFKHHPYQPYQQSDEDGDGDWDKHYEPDHEDNDNAEQLHQSRRLLSHRTLSSAQKGKFSRKRVSSAGRCMSMLPPSKPVWSVVPQWWEHEDDNNEFGHVGSGPAAYFKDGTWFYYKDFEVYEKMLDMFNGDNTAAYPINGWHPYYYYSQVSPLASFNVVCGPKYVKQLKHFCWNNHFKHGDSKPIHDDEVKPEPQTVAQPKPSEPAPLARPLPSPLSKPLPTPQSSPEPMPLKDLKPADMHKQQPAPQAQASVKPGAKPEDQPAPQLRLLPQNVSTTVPRQQPALQPEHKPAALSKQQPTPQPLPSVKPAPQPEAHPAPQPQHKPAEVPKLQPAPLPEHKPSALPKQPATPHGAPQPLAKTAPKLEAQPAPQQEHKPAAMPEKQLAPQPEHKPALQSENRTAAEPKPQPENRPAAEHMKPQPEHKPAAEPKQQPASQPEHKPAAMPMPQPAPEIKPTVPVQQPAPLPGHKPTAVPVKQPAPQPLPVAQPTPKPEAQKALPNQQPTSHTAPVSKQTPTPTPAAVPSQHSSPQPQHKPVAVAAAAVHKDATIAQAEAKLAQLPPHNATTKPAPLPAANTVAPVGNTTQHGVMPKPTPQPEANTTGAVTDNVQNTTPVSNKTTAVPHNADSPKPDNTTATASQPQPQYHFFYYPDRGATAMKQSAVHSSTTPAALPGTKEQPQHSTDITAASPAAAKPDQAPAAAAPMEMVV